MPEVKASKQVQRLVPTIQGPLLCITDGATMIHADINIRSMGPISEVDMVRVSAFCVDYMRSTCYTCLRFIVIS